MLIHQDANTSAIETPINLNDIDTNGSVTIKIKKYKKAQISAPDK